MGDILAQAAALQRSQRRLIMYVLGLWVLQGVVLCALVILVRR